MSLRPRAAAPPMLFPQLPLHLLLPLALLGTATLAASGWLVAHALVRHSPGESAGDLGLRTLLVALGWGFGLTPTFAFFVHALAGPPVGVAWLLALAALQAWLATEALLRTRRVAGFGAALWAPDRLVALARDHGPVLAASLAVAVFYFLKHDSSVPPSSCIGEAAICAIGHGPVGCDVLRGNIGDAQLGNSGVLAGFLALFGQAGFRWLYATVGLLFALGGFLLGRRAGGGHRGWGWFGLLLLPLNPYVASIPLLDENLLTLAWSVVLLPLLFVPPVPWLAAGALFGLVVAMRHPMVVCLPALLLLALAPIDGGEPRRRLLRAGRLVLGFVLLTAVENLHHLLAMGSLFRFEHNTQYPPMPYRLFGFELQWEGMVNWPLLDEVVRTPHNPFPTFLMWPLWLVDHLGLLLCAAMLLGVVVLWRRNRREAAFWLAWWVPVHLGLSLQEAWDYPNKMGILIIVFAPVVVWSVAGLRALATRPRLGVPALVLLAVAAKLGVATAGSYAAPTDRRYFERFDLEPVAIGSHEAWARQRATDVGWLPDLDRLHRYGPVLSRDNIAGLFHADRLRGWGWHPGTVPPRGEPVTFELDLGAAIWGRSDFVRVVDGPADLDLTRGDGLQVMPQLAVPWEPTPLTLVAGLGPDLAMVEIAFRDFRGREPGCDPTREFCHCRFFNTLNPGADRQTCAGLREVPAPGPKVRVRAPAGGLSVFATVNPVGNVVFLWTGVLARAGLTLRGPVEFWHN